MSNTSRCAWTILILIGQSISANASAQSQDRNPGVYVDIGRAPHGGDSGNSVTAGLVVPYALMDSMNRGPLSFYADYFVSVWNAPAPRREGGHRSYYQIGAIANLRWRFLDGGSPWFGEAGIGVTTMDDLYSTTGREFSTRFQFTEQIGVGYSVGATGHHEVSMRLQHFSNADIKRPNPGENWIRVRYLYRF